MRNSRRLIMSAASILGASVPANALQYVPGKASSFPSLRCFESATLVMQLPALAHGFARTLPTFLVAEIILLACFMLGCYGLGWRVRERGWNANYTRKLLGVILIVVPIALGRAFSYTTNPIHVMVSMVLFLGVLLLFLQPLRDRSSFLVTAFAAFDRPEDRPFTLAWFLSAYVVSCILIIGMILFVKHAASFIPVTLIAIALGDLLAGAVGYHCGKYRYTTGALFTDQTYTRSLEGSLALFLVAVLVVVFLGSRFGVPTGLLAPAVIVLPLTLTVAEAYSPHTWDEPVMLSAAMLAWLALSKMHGADSFCLVG